MTNFLFLNADKAKWNKTEYIILRGIFTVQSTKDLVKVNDCKVFLLFSL